MKKTCIALLLLTLLVATFYHEALLCGRTFMARDHHLFFNPRRHFAAETLQSGELPLWNPYVACGVPFQANLQSSVLYPLSVLYYGLPFQRGYAWFVVVHYVLAALGMFVLLRRWGQGRFPAVLSGMVFALGGYLVSINDNLAFLTAGAWLPWVMLAGDQLVRSGSLRATLACGVLIALQIFAGDASFYLLASLLCTGAWTLFCTAGRGGRGTCSAARVWGMLGAGWAVGLLLAAVQLVPFAEFVAHSTRSTGLGFEQASKWSLHPLELIGLLCPYFFGTLVPSARWFGQQWLDTLYIGVVPLALALLYLWSGRGRLRLWLAFLAGAGVFLALGAYNPVYGLLYRMVPGVAMVQYPVKFLFLSAFALAFMAGMGLTELTGRVQDDQFRKKLAAFGLVGGGVLLAGAGLAFLLQDRLFEAFCTVYPRTAYLLLFRRDVFQETLRACLVPGLLLGVFGALVVLARTPKRRAVLPAALVLVAFIDLAAIGRPADPLLPDEYISKTPQIVRVLQDRQDRPFRVYSRAAAATGRTYRHVRGMPFEKTYPLLRESLTADLNMYDHICSAEENAALLHRRYYDVFHAVEEYVAGVLPPGKGPAVRAVLSMLNVTYLISPVKVPLPGLEQVVAGPLRVYCNPQALGPAYVVPRIEVLSDDAEVLQALRDPAFDPAAMAWCTRADWGGGEAPAPTSPCAEARVTITSRTATTVELQADMACAGLLVLAENYYPGWGAVVDGRKMPVLRVNHTLQGLWLPAGSHAVKFVFRPRSFFIGAVISLITGCVLAGAWAAGRRRQPVV